MAEKGFAGGEGLEELTVEVVSVGEDDDGRVFGGDALGDFARVKCHCETFTAALGMPDDADFLVVGGIEALEGGVVGFVGGVVLVVGGDFFVEVAAVWVEDDEVAEDVEDGLFGEDAFDGGFEFGAVFGGDGFSVDGSPGEEAF